MEDQKITAPASKQEVSDSFAPGAAIDNRYKILKKIGSGGAGVVFKVADTQNGDKILALKMMTVRPDDDETTLKRFQNELELTASLNHPNIVKMYDVAAAADGQHYITMEFIEGGTLGKWIKSQQSNTKFLDVLRILKQIAAALAHAHSMGIVHRDLKPDNVLLNESLHVKVTDFGLARKMAPGFSMTQSGHTVGTPLYMSPEQFRGERADARSDIYSFGILAHEMVSGTHPFRSEDYQELALKHFTNDLPLVQSSNNEIPHWFDAFLNACCKKSPERRYQSMEQIAATLDKKLSAPQETAFSGIKRLLFSKL